MWKVLSLAAATGLLAVTTAADGRWTSTAVELQQALGKGDRLELVLSDQGASATETRGKTRVGVIVRYEDAHIFALDSTAGRTPRNRSPMSSPTRSASVPSSER
jgi:hypothetical protein